MLEDTHPVSMRAAWSISVFCDKHPCFIESRIPEIIAALREINSESIKRSLLKLLTYSPVPEEYSGILFDLCFNIVESPGSAIAQKAYAMTILYNISETEPDLKPELIALFESLCDDESPGIRSCSKNNLKHTSGGLLQSCRASWLKKGWVSLWVWDWMCRSFCPC